MDMNEDINEVITDKEIWRDISGYVGLYKVSNKGRIIKLKTEVVDKNGIRRVVKGHILKQSKDKDGYCLCGLRRDGKTKTFKVHRLVANEFIDNPTLLPQVNHKDENKENNTVENLEWCNATYNNNYGTRNARSSKTHSENPNAHKYGSENSFYGKHHTEELKEYLSNRFKGKLTGAESSHAKRIMQFTKNGEFVREWGSITDACNAIGKNTRLHISECICGKLNSSHGYIWIYKEDYSDDLLKEMVYRANNPRTHTKEIWQYSKCDEFIAKYNSVTEASNKTGVQISDIISCAKKRLKSAGGYKWYYEKREDDEYV